MKHSSSTTLRTAFSLVELSLVMVVIGLLIGGIIAGRSMIRASELRSVMTDANNYITAANNFRQQYRYVAGDAPNAATYWSTTTAGDGNGLVEGAERYRFWQQLNLAGFIENNYSGAQGGGGAEDFVLGENIPAARVRLTGFGFYYANLVGDATNTTTTYSVNLGNAFTYGLSAGSNNGAPLRATLTPTEAMGIDTKVDDGRPGTGKWVANLTGPAGAAAAYNFGGASACSTDPDGSTTTGNYSTTINIASCSFFFMSGY